MDTKKQSQYEYRKSLPSWEKRKEQIKIARKKYYQKNKEKIKLKVRDWENKNPERKKEISKKAIKKLQDQGYFKNAMKKYYQKNKEKHNSRTNTSKIIKGQSYTKPIFPKDFFQCKKCGSKEKLQIHHEIYPQNKKEIVKSINNNEIYYLCKKCHKKTHSH